MGRLNLNQIGEFSRSENTLKEYDNEISEELLSHRLKQIVSLLKKDSGGCLCYVFGMGAQTKSLYKNLEKESGVEVIWFKSIFPRSLRFISAFVASYAGLIKVIDIDKLPEVFEELSHLSMAGIYVFDQSKEKDFLEAVSKHPNYREFDFTLKNDDRYFMYVVDADNAESSTGIYEIVSYGQKASKFSEIF